MIEITDERTVSARSAFNSRVQLVCVASVPVFIIVWLIGMCLAGLIPPPPAHDSASEIAAYYAGDTNRIRLGLALALVGSAFWGPLITVITTQMLRRPELKVIAYLQLGTGVAGWLFLIVPFLFMTAAAFRPERDPEITQALHDTGFIFLFMPLTTFVIQNLVIAVAVLTDKSPRPVFPRWIAYVNLLEALLFGPVLVLTFFKTGPFAYHGLLVFWIPLAIFPVWLLSMAWCTWRAADDELAPMDEASARG